MVQSGENTLMLSVLIITIGDRNFVVLGRAAEQAHALYLGAQVSGQPTVSLPIVIVDAEFSKDMVVYNMGKTYFDAKEFNRCAKAMRGCNSRQAIFLRLYATYLVRGLHVFVDFFFSKKILYT